MPTPPRPSPLPTTHLLYLHGFRSSPQSNKARLMAQAVAQRHPHVTWWCPQLPASPREAVEMLMHGITHWPHAQMAVVGSSLGGFYATWLAEQTGCRAAVLNPSVQPARDLANRIGTHQQWHNPQETFVFRADYVDELQALTLPELAHPERYYALIAKGDELLDWREMLARYAAAQVRLLEGSNHAIDDFPVYLDEVLEFLNLA